MRLRLRNIDDVLDIIGGNGREIPQGDGQIPIWLPLRKEITRGEYRLEAVLDTGDRWAANVTVPSVPPTPILLLDPSAGHVGATVNFRVAHFPSDTELQVTFWQGHTGHGVFSGMLGATGGLSGSFRIPPIVTAFTQTGWHDIEASTSMRPASARAPFNVTPLPADQVVELDGSRRTSSNAHASFSLDYSGKAGPAHSGPFHPEPCDRRSNSIAVHICVYFRPAWSLFLTYRAIFGYERPDTPALLPLSGDA
jgi:hypothetical protein